MNNSVFDLKTYKLPQDRGKPKSLPLTYEPLPRLTENVRFDIYDYEHLFRDEETRRIIREGKTIGCFYIESPGMRSLLKKLSCDTFEMLTAASSVIRPGVAESGMMQEFIARHKNPKRRKYLVPQMEEILGETYGVMIYQEDVIKVAHHIAGLTLEEADLLRRAMSGKMRSHGAMRKMENRFLDSCRERGLEPVHAKELWRQISSFAGYAFCKAHSASFALLSFQVAFLKAHYPAEFMASVLSNRGGYYSAAVYVQEAKRLGLKILLPSVNDSEYEYTGEKDVIRIGFMAIKNFSRGSAERIIEERAKNGKFRSLADFIARVGLGPEETALLIKCGAMGCFRKTRPTLMRLLDIYMSRRRLLATDEIDMFKDEFSLLEKEAETSVQYSLEEICAIEYETFGYMATRHPLHFFRSAIDAPGVITASETRKYNGRRVKMVGWYMASKRIKTKKGEIMKFLSLEDLTGTFEAVIFPKAYARCAELTLSMGPYLVEGKIDTDGGNNIVVDKLAVLSAKDISSVTQKDSSENKYFGDVEKVNEEEFAIVNSLDKEKLRRAYL